MFFDPLTLVFMALAGFVIYKLYTILGTRTGEEKSRDDFSPPMGEGKGSSEIIQFPQKNQKTEDISPENRLKGVVPADSPAYKGLLAVMKADPSFDPAGFIQGACAAYEMIVMAFAQGNRTQLQSLLAKSVYSGFDRAIAEREQKNWRVETQFVSIDKSDFYDAFLRSQQSEITVRFQSKLITATLNQAGEVVEGSRDKMIDVTDIWTFARDVTSRDPNWLLITTQSSQ